IADYRESIAAADRLRGKSKVRPWAIESRTRLQQHVGRLGNKDEALALGLEAVRLAEELVRDEPANTRALVLLADAQRTLACPRAIAGRMPDAVKILEQAVATYDRLVAHDPENGAWQAQRGLAYRALADDQRLTGDAAAAGASARRAIAALAPLV